VLWLSAGDTALAAVWILGALCALAAVFLPWQRAALAGCLVLWLSLCAVGQDFLSFQWDLLLLEAGFLAIFADDSPIRVWLFRWLIFRLMFSSGAMKLLSGDPTWRGLTALTYHYETQPLPTPPAWYMHQLPLAFQKASTLFVLIAELAVPLLFFLPRPFRRAGASITIALQILILVTGNYTFFNWLTIALALWLFIEPGPQPKGRHLIASIALAAFIGVSSVLVMLELFSVPLPPAAGDRALPAAPGLATVVRRPGYLPGEPLVRELHAAPVTRRAARDAATGVQSISPGAAQIHPRAPVYVPLYSLGPTGLVDPRRARPVLSGSKLEVNLTNENSHGASLQKSQTTRAGSSRSPLHPS
jgi:hypothetical protein